MQNVQKYFLLLESLQFGESAQDDDRNLKTNLAVLKKYIKDEEFQSNETLRRYKNQIPDENSSESWEYAYYLFHLILTIKSAIDLDGTERENLISVRHQNALLNTIRLASRYGIVNNLPEYLRNHQIFKMSSNSQHPDEAKLKSSLLILSNIFSVTSISSNRLTDSVVLEMLAGVYSSEDVDRVPLLNMLWECTPKENYFRYLLILKSIRTLPKQIQEALHKDLLARLIEPGGFKLLVLNTVPAASGSSEIPNWKRYEVVARIIAHKGHRSAFYKQMVDQIFDFITNSLFDVMESSLVPAGVVTLRKLYLLDGNVRNEIENRIGKIYEPLTDCEDSIAGLVVMESDEVEELVKLQCILFNGSAFEALPSSILVKFLPVLIALFALCERCHVASSLITLISRCMANRQPDELRAILKVIFNRHENDLRLTFLNDRIGVRKNDDSGQYQLQVVPPDFGNSIDLPVAVVKILKNCNNNILTYNCFIQILKLFDEIESTQNTEADLLQTEEELEAFLARKFQTRIAIVSFLTDLISFRQFHSQFEENPGDILEFLQNALHKRMHSSSDAFDLDENLPVLLAIFQEFIENAKSYTRYQGLKGSLRDYANQVKNQDLKHQIESIIALIDGCPRTTGIDCSDFNYARSLMSESQAHLRVYGMMQFMKLLKERNEDAIGKRHSILAMAMHALRDEESYTYLNCVRLLVCLTNFMQAEVLETLSAEYLNEHENIEFRLKLGEAILRVTEELGPISYNFKDVLINCFLFGSRNEIDEFRASSMSNLATVCRLLSYQVHNFFHEMLTLIESTLQTDTYLPARRAATLILSQLLWGMDNLVDFQEILLPIYRLLTGIVKNDKDEKTRIHATNGLTYLKDKCKEFLFPDQSMAKEIRIFGINDSEIAKKKGHILEL